MNVNTNAFQTGLDCALNFDTMHAHKSTVKKKMAGKGNKLKDFLFSYRSHVNILKISILSLFDVVPLSCKRDLCEANFDKIIHHALCHLKCRPGSHQTSFQYEELMIDIIKHFKADNDTEALKKLLKISYNHG